jgi:putative ABC transport system ATP-binding protein
MLTLTSVYKTFFPGTAGEVRSLRGVTLDVAEGSFVIVIGLNGSGKSTLLNAIAGTFLVDSGQIVCDGTDITSWSEQRRAALIGRVFQDPFTGSAPSMSIAENIALAARRGLGRGLTRAVSRGLVDEARETLGRLGLGLEARLGAPMRTLSGGQRQVLTLLMATWRKPRLLLLDEHTAALDPKSAELVLRLSEDIIREHHLTTVMVTHSMQQATNMGDRLIMMHAGRVIHDATGAEKRRLRHFDLLNKFEDVRREDMLDESAAHLLQETYV